MIPAGHAAVDIAGIAELHGLTLRQARTRRPWSQPGHPSPLTRGRPARGRPQLWDRDQAAAYARGEPIPPLPSPGDPLDLLDVTEAAELVGLTVATWTRYETYERARTRPPDEQPIVPPPDTTVCDVAHWHRRTVESYRDDRAARAGTSRGGRPAGTTEHIPRAELGPRVAELLDQARRDGETLTTAEIARQLGVSYRAALTHVHRHADTPRSTG